MSKIYIVLNLFAKHSYLDYLFHFIKIYIINAIKSFPFICACFLYLYCSNLKN